jgi:hypothetical protein
MHSLLGGLAAVALGLAAFAGRFEPSQPFDFAQGRAAAAADGERRMPERPRQRVDVAPVAVTGRTISVAANGDLQAAIDAAKPGDAIALEPGATYRGPFRLPRKDGDGWIVICAGRGLPPPNGASTRRRRRPCPGSCAASGDA